MITSNNATEKQEVSAATIINNIKYTVLGVVFGVVFIKSEVVSWFRIQEMFHFQSFHMFGIIGSAILVSMVSLQAIKRFQLKTFNGMPIHVSNKKFHWGNVWGSLIFGSGWAITGACPGPLFAQIGVGYGIVAITLLSAVAGTWVYGLLRTKLPH